MSNSYGSFIVQLLKKLQNNIAPSRLVKIFFKILTMIRKTKHNTSFQISVLSHILSKVVSFSVRNSWKNFRTL